MKTSKGLLLTQIHSQFNNAVAANATHLALFKGQMPDLNKVFNVANSLSSTMPNTVTALGINQSDFLGSLIMSAYTPVRNVTARTLTIPFGSSTSKFLGAANGTPTWFCLRTAGTSATAGFAGFNVSTVPTVLIIGTAGADGSDAELQITGGVIEAGKQYSILDLTFQL